MERRPTCTGAVPPGCLSCHQVACPGDLFRGSKPHRRRRGGVAVDTCLPSIVCRDIGDGPRRRWSLRGGQLLQQQGSAPVRGTAALHTSSLHPPRARNGARCTYPIAAVPGDMRVPTNAVAKEQVMTSIGESRHEAGSCPPQLLLPAPLAWRRRPLSCRLPGSCVSRRCSRSSPFPSPRCGDGSRRARFRRPSSCPLVSPRGALKRFGAGLRNRPAAFRGPGSRRGSPVAVASRRTDPETPPSLPTFALGGLPFRGDHASRRCVSLKGSSGGTRRRDRHHAIDWSIGRHLGRHAIGRTRG